MMAEHRHLVDQGAPLVELRLDYIQAGAPNVKRLLTDRPGPVIITCRRERDGGKWIGNEENRQLLLRTAIAEGADYVDLEEDIAGRIPRYGNTKRIISYHNFRRTPDELDELHERMSSLDADVVKIATMANHPRDNVRMLTLMKRSETPTVGLCMGDVGTLSRLLAGKFGAPFTYATFHHERELAPGQISFHHMQEIYHYERINADTDVYGVIGDPVSQSHSPLVHNMAFAHLGLNKVYLPVRVPRGDVAEFLEDAPKLGFKGLSVTIPHKESVIRHMTKVDGAVRAAGSANTLVFRDDEIVGYNTDYRAAMDSLETAMRSDGSTNTNPLRGKTVLMLGAGGVARSIAHGLKRREANLIVTSRTAERADEIAERVGCKSIDWSARHMVTADVIINCTPVGMHPNVDDTPFERHRLRPSTVVFDTVYNPENTMLIKDARERSCRVVTGVDMFIRQAALQFELFTGRQPPADLMRDALKRATGAVKY